MDFPMKTYSNYAVLSLDDGTIIETLPLLYSQIVLTKKDNYLPSEKLSTILDTFECFEHVCIQSPY